MTARVIVSRSAFVLAAACLSSVAFAQAEAPPVCINGGPYVAECTGPVTTVGLDGSASFDPDGTPVTFFWFDECPFGFFDDPTSPTTNFVMDNTGVCSRQCVIVLRVTSAGQMTPCQTTVTVQDTTAPVITCPPDVVELWTVGPAGGQTDPSLTGFATAVDCDPAPVITYSDVLDPGVLPGEPETIVTRTWCATDFCNLQACCNQTITLLSPGGALGARMDVMPGSCPNTFSSGGEGVMNLVIFGTSTFDATAIDRSSLALQRSDNVGGAVTRMSSRILEKGRPGGNATCACGSATNDGRLDLQLSFDKNQLATDFQLTAEAPGTDLTFSVTGKLTNGQWFTVKDCVRLPD